MAIYAAFLCKADNETLTLYMNYTYCTSFDLASDAESDGEWDALSGAVVNPWMGDQLSGPSDFDLRHQINGHSGFPMSSGTRYCFPTNWHLGDDAIAASPISGGQFNVLDPSGSRT
jgi:hypothetical protein